MTLLGISRQIVLLWFSGMCLTGCIPGSANPLDEEKDPHFLKGKSRLHSMDYHGAIEEFEKSLQTNPHSASAHKQLGLIHYKRMDFAAAIYHFQKLLRLRPQDEHAQLLQEYIQDCKQQLARTVLLAPVSPALQRDLERMEALNRENAELRQRIAVLEAQLAHQPSAAVSAHVPPLPAPVTPSAAATGRMTAATLAVSAASAQKTHTIKSGDTMYGIGKRYGVSEDAIKRANPGVDPHRLQLGQVLKIPSP